jgi:hypothetical protein
MSYKEEDEQSTDEDTVELKADRLQYLNDTLALLDIVLKEQGV